MLPELLVKNAQSEVVHSLIVDEGSFTVGREPDCSIVLPTPDVSRHHAAFSHSALCGVLTVEDQHSKNGLFVNGLQMRRSVLYTGDVVAIGDYRILVRQGSAGPKNMAAIVAQLRKA